MGVVADSSFFSLFSVFLDTTDYKINRLRIILQSFWYFLYIVLYNQPKICTNATWNESGITFANQSTIGSEPRGIFIDYNDTIYVADHSNGRILVWYKENINPMRMLTVKLFVYTSLFVTFNGDIYFENADETGRIDKWSKCSTASVLVTKFSGNCYGIFIDIENNLYCSIRYEHRVVKVSLSSGINTGIAVAGTKGSTGSNSNELFWPWGIFVDINFNLYVADSKNDRIQLFRSGQLNGTTLAGKGIPNNLQLQFPTDVILDADGLLYIADNQKHRIIRAGPDGYQCIAGCTDRSGSASNQFQIAYALRFDSYGNLYVADEYNHRVQKFSLATNSCGTSFEND